MLFFASRTSARKGSDSVDVASACAEWDYHLLSHLSDHPHQHASAFADIVSWWWLFVAACCTGLAVLWAIVSRYPDPALAATSGGSGVATGALSSHAIVPGVARQVAAEARPHIQVLPGRTLGGVGTAVWQKQRGGNASGAASAWGGRGGDEEHDGLASGREGGQGEDVEAGAGVEVHSEDRSLSPGSGSADAAAAAAGGGLARSTQRLQDAPSASASHTAQQAPSEGGHERRHAGSAGKASDRSDGGLEHASEGADSVDYSHGEKAQSAHLLQELHALRTLLAAAEARAAAHEER